MKMYRFDYKDSAGWSKEANIVAEDLFQALEKFVLRYDKKLLDAVSNIKLLGDEGT